MPTAAQLIAQIKVEGAEAYHREMKKASAASRETGGGFDKMAAAAARASKALQKMEQQERAVRRSAWASVFNNAVTSAGSGAPPILRLFSALPEVSSRVGAGLMKVEKVVVSLGQRLGNLASILVRITSSSPLLLAGGTSALIGGGIGLGMAAWNAFSEREQALKTLEALTSPEKARQKIEFMKALSVPATLGMPELTALGTALEGYGLRIERVLPLVAKLKAAHPMRSGDTAVSIFGRLASGDFPDVEALSGFGLSHFDFEQKGIKFDANRHLLSSVRQTMEAAEAIVEDKYGKILDMMASTTKSKTETLKNTWQEALVKIGDALTKNFLPALELLNKNLDRLSKSKGFDDFLKDIAKNFLKFELIMTSVFTGILLFMAILKLSMKDFFGATVAVLGAAIVAFGGLSIGGDIRRWIKELDRMKAAGEKPVDATVPKDPTPDEGFGRLAEKNPILEKIERNTHKSAEWLEKAFDLRRYSLGGGELTAMGIPIIEEFQGMRRAGAGGGGRVQVNVQGAQSFEEVVMSTVLSLQRQGVLA